MVMIQDKNGVERFSVSSVLYNMCLRMKDKILNDDSEVWGVFFGKRGTGKSLLAQRIGFIIDPTLDITRICHTKEEFIDAVINNTKKVIIADEAISIFFSRASTTREGRLVAEISDQIRQKNLCVFLCIPQLLSLDWMVIECLDFACHVWEDKKLINGRKVTRKGNANFWLKLGGSNKVTKVVQYSRKKRSNPTRFNKRPVPHHTEAGNPIGDTFKKPWYPVDEKKYREKKESILNKYKKGSEAPKRNRQQHIDYLMMDSMIKNKVKNKDIAEKMGVNLSTITRFKRKMQLSA